jgi:hypothetical protein
MRILRTRLFDDSLQRLRVGDLELFMVVAAAVDYLVRLKRGAELPPVRRGQRGSGDRRRASI